MKKFLFTLAAVLMSASVFAQTDAPYLYVNSALTAEDPSVENGLVLTVSAEFPGYVSAMEVNILLPEGMTATFYEAGYDSKFTYTNGRGRAQTGEPSFSTQDYTHYVIITGVGDDFWNPDGNGWVRAGTWEWAPGYYEEFMLVYVEYDDTYHGGNVRVQTIPTCGKDERDGLEIDGEIFQTITLLGDKSRDDIITDATELLPDPNPAGKQDCAKPSITWVTNDDEVVVTVTWNESDGEKVYTGENTYTRPEYGQPDESYNVEAYTRESENFNESPHATETIPVPAKDPVWQSVDKPTISYTMDDDNVYVTVTWPTTTGQKVYTGQDVYPRPEYGQPDESYNVEAYTEADYPYSESEHETATIPVPAKDPVWQSVDKPAISYTMDDDNVYVTVTWPTTTGNQVYTGQDVYPRPEYGQPDESYNVEAYTEADYPYAESEHETATIPVPAKDPVWQSVDKPTISYTMDDDNVYVTITWPTTTGNHVYTGQDVYPRPEYGQPDESYNVEAYTEADYPYSESEHATETIPVPAKEQVLPVETTTYVKVTSADQIVAGKKYILVCGELAMGAIANNAGTPVAVTVNGDEVEAGEDVMVFTLGGTQYMFTLAVGDQYLRPNGASNTGISLGASAYWKPAAANGGFGALSDASDGGRGILYRASENCFRHYAKSNVGSGYEYALLYVEKTDEPEAPAAPEITITGEEGTQMTVTVTAEEGCTLIVNGEEIDNNTYTYTVDRADVYTAGTVEVTAKAVKDGVESDEATASKEFVVEDRPIAAEPVIEFVETKDGDVVTAVEVVVTNATEYHIWVNEVQVRGEKYYANYNEALNIHVEALNDPGYPYIANDNEGDYTLAKLAKKDVAKPTITVTGMDENNVYVEVTWPAETDGEQVYTGEYTYARPEYNQPDESYNVEAYVAEGTEWNASEHEYATIPVPAKDIPTPEIEATPKSGKDNPNVNEGKGYYQVSIDAVDDEGAVVYYRVYIDGVLQDADVNDGWQVYDGTDLIFTDYGSYVVESYVDLNGKESPVGSSENFVIDENTAVYDLNGEKAVASVRYFNLNGQEMQEANGMTIIVTTYTDGTSSAVKVMK